MNTEARIRLIAGIFILTSVALSYFFTPLWQWFSVFVGVMLVQSAFTRWCVMEKILKRLGLAGSEL